MHAGKTSVEGSVTDDATCKFNPELMCLQSLPNATAETGKNKVVILHKMIGEWRN